MLFLIHRTSKRKSINWMRLYDTIENKFSLSSCKPTKVLTDFSIFRQIILNYYQMIIHFDIHFCFFLVLSRHKLFKLAKHIERFYLFIYLFSYLFIYIFIYIFYLFIIYLFILREVLISYNHSFVALEYFYIIAIFSQIILRTLNLRLFK